jgi:pyruvate/2-oxoglutarate/acetoin dehydrogenase E1 component
MGDDLVRRLAAFAAVVALAARFVSMALAQRERPRACWVCRRASTRVDTPPGDHRTPIGKARVVRPGAEATVITYGSGVQLALELDPDVEVLDLRTLWPLDHEAILDSVGRTSRALVLQEAPRSGGVAGLVLSLLVREGFELLDAPPALVAPPDTPVPFAPELEDAYLPSAGSLAAAVEELLAY